MAKEKDRISSLPDHLLLEIISRIKIRDKRKQEERIMSTKEVIKTTTTISKRWRHLWTLLPTLVFIYDDFMINRSYTHSDFTNYHWFIDEALAQCPTDVNLKKFKLQIGDVFQVNTWMRYAITRNVQEIDLSLGYESCDDQLFFNNSCLISMKLSHCVFNPPTGAIRCDKLKFLCIHRGELDGDSIVNILSGSPSLETLQLNDCRGFRRIDVTSKSVKNLVLSGYAYSCPGEDYYIDKLEINAPYILSLTIEGNMYLEELSLQNVSSLVKADLDYTVDYYFVRELGRDHDVVKEELFRGLLSSLGHVNEIALGTSRYTWALSRLEATGFQFRKASYLRGICPNEYQVFLLNP